MTLRCILNIIIQLWFCFHLQRIFIMAILKPRNYIFYWWPWYLKLKDCCRIIGIAWFFYIIAILTLESCLLESWEEDANWVESFSIWGFVGAEYWIEVEQGFGMAPGFWPPKYGIGWSGWVKGIGPGGTSAETGNEWSGAMTTEGSKPAHWNIIQGLFWTEHLNFQYQILKKPFLLWAPSPPALAVCNKKEKKLLTPQRINMPQPLGLNKKGKNHLPRFFRECCTLGH